MIAGDGDGLAMVVQQLLDAPPAARRWMDQPLMSTGAIVGLNSSTNSSSPAVLPPAQGLGPVDEMKRQPPISLMTTPAAGVLWAARVVNWRSAGVSSGGAGDGVGDGTALSSAASAMRQ